MNIYSCEVYLALTRAKSCIRSTDHRTHNRNIFDTAVRFKFGDTSINTIHSKLLEGGMDTDEHARVLACNCALVIRSILAIESLIYKMYTSIHFFPIYPPTHSPLPLVVLTIAVYEVDARDIRTCCEDVL